MRYLRTAGFMACIWATASVAQDTHQPYAGLETREIAALSADDIAELEAGRGWGLALPAELNGYPGPTHVLELAAALGLSDAERDRVQTIFEEMRQEAVDAGRALIMAEAALDRAFAERRMTAGALRDLVEAAADARGKLRLVHLSRHLQTIEVLSADQVEQYNVLRGYGADPCLAVPEGHDAEMWRRHNGCGG